MAVARAVAVRECVGLAVARRGGGARRADGAELVLERLVLVLERLILVPELAQRRLVVLGGGATHLSVSCTGESATVSRHRDANGGQVAPEGWWWNGRCG